MSPELAAMLIASLTDSVIRISAKHGNVSFEERKTEVISALKVLQPNADDLEKWLRDKDVV